VVNRAQGTDRIRDEIRIGEGAHGGAYGRVFVAFLGVEHGRAAEGPKRNLNVAPWSPVRTYSVAVPKTL
jgi:hypothetical protein